MAAVGDSRSVPSLERLVLEHEGTQAWFCSDGGERDRQILKALQNALAGRPKAAVVAIPWPPGITGPNAFFQGRTPEDFETLLASVPRPQPAQSPNASNSARCFTETPEGLDACFDGRRYELRAIRKPGPGRLRATLRALGDNGRFVVETVNFYYLRSRRGFVAEAARMFRQTLDTIEADLGRMTDELERYMQRLIVGSAPVARAVEGMDRAEGFQLGRAADLVDQIVRDMGSLGVIGYKRAKVEMFGNEVTLVIETKLVRNKKQDDKDVEEKEENLERIPLLFKDTSATVADLKAGKTVECRITRTGLKSLTQQAKTKMEAGINMKAQGEGAKASISTSAWFLDPSRKGVVFVSERKIQ